MQTQIDTRSQEQLKAARKAAILAYDPVSVIIKVHGLMRVTPQIRQRQISEQPPSLGLELSLKKADSGHPFFHNHPGVCTNTVIDQLAARSLGCVDCYYEEASHGVIMTMVFQKTADTAGRAPYYPSHLLLNAPRQCSAWGNLQIDTATHELVRIDSLRLNYAQNLPGKGITGALSLEGRQWLIK